jgi:hypothetical protein
MREVVLRAGDRCEYCLMHQSLQGATFHIEHVVPQSHGGKSLLANLALACARCNLRKAECVQAIDRESGNLVSLFNPRVDEWREHFEWHGFLLVPRSPTGRATIDRLELNHP